MASKEFIAPSGAKVTINSAAWLDAMALKTAVVKEVKKVDASDAIKNFFGEGGVKLADMEVSVEALSGAFTFIAGLDCSEEVQNALMRCLSRCTYKPAGDKGLTERISDATFEDDNARQDYYEIVLRCCEVNLSPFFKGLVSRLNGIGKLIAKDSNTPK